MIFDTAEGADEVYGIGYIKEIRADYEENVADGDGDPPCRNDHEFALVARKWGYSNIPSSYRPKELVLPLC